MGGQNVGNPGEHFAGQRQRTGRDSKVGVHDVGPPLPDVAQRRKERSRQIPEHFRHRAEVRAAAESGGAENFDTVPDLLLWKIRHPDRLDAHAVPATNKRGPHIVGHPPPTAADRRVFVAEDEDFHFRNRS